MTGRTTAHLTNAYDDRYVEIERLHGAEASIRDLRAGASLILAALAADGGSLIHGAHHVHRGYENIDRKFQQLGARISRTADAA